jgi:hypothetical protein
MQILVEKPEMIPNLDYEDYSKYVNDQNAT